MSFNSRIFSWIISLSSSPLCSLLEFLLLTLLFRPLKLVLQCSLYLLSSLCGFCSIFFFFFFFFLGLHLRHMEIPRLGVESKLQLPAYTIAIATPDPSRICNLHHSSWQHQMLNPLNEARDRTCNLMVPSWIHFRCATTGTPVFALFSEKFFLL